MKINLKTCLVMGTVASAALLTACQSTAPSKEPRMHGGKYKHGHMMQKRHHAQKHVRHQMQQLCTDKTAGQKVTFNGSQQNISGQCQMVFIADQSNKQLRKTMKRPTTATQPQVRPYRGAYAAPLTDAQRVELVKQYDLRLTQRQAKQSAIQKACQAKTHNTKVTLKLAEQTIDGRCMLKFSPDVAVNTQKS